MTPEVRIDARQVATLIGGSYRAHEELLTAVLQLMALKGLEPVPIVTGPRVAPRKDGGFDLRKNVAQRGFGDAVGFVPPRGRTLMVECKTGQARRSPAQVRMHQRLTRNGVLCITARSGRLDEFHAYLSHVIAVELATVRALAGDQRPA